MKASADCPGNGGASPLRCYSATIAKSLLLALVFASASAGAEEICAFSHNEYRSCGKDPEGAGVVCDVEPVQICVSLDTGRSFDFRKGDGGDGGPAREGLGGQSGSTEIESCADADGEPSVTSAPVLIASGEKILSDTDFSAGESFPLVLSRIYHSANQRSGAFGARWSSTVDYGLIFEHGGVQCDAKVSGATICNTSTTGLDKLYSKRPGGGLTSFVKQANGDWTNKLTGWDTLLQKQADGTWLYWQKDGLAEIYNAGGQPLEMGIETGSGQSFAYVSGKLASITHTSGRTLTFNWSGTRVSSVVAGGKTYSYGYAPTGYLATVTYPDSLGVRTYHYEVSGKPWLVTGISVDGVRNTRYGYFADGRVQTSGYEDGRETSSFAYAADRTTVTNALGQAKVYHLDANSRVTKVDRPATATCPAGATSSQYDGDGKVTLELDGVGNKTTYSYTSLGRLSEKRTGIAPTGGTSKQQITKYDWDSSELNILSVKEYGAATTNLIRETVFTYYDGGDARDGLVETVTVHDRTGSGAAARTTTYNYLLYTNGELQQVSVDGPLSGTTDRTTYNYNTLGNLTKVTNGLGHITRLSYHTVRGHPGRITDPNGLIIDFVYDAKGRITRRTINAAGGNRVFQYVYDAFDNLVQVTDSSGRVTDYGVNGAGHETVVREPSAHPNPMTQDATDARVLYHNDLNQLVGEYTLKRWLKRVIVGWEGGEPIESWVSQHEDFGARTWAYDGGGFLSNAYGENGQNTKFNYNATGDLWKVTDSLNLVTTTLYDTHNRIKSIAAPNGGVASFEYSPLGWLTKVTDREGKITQYTYNGFGDVVRIVSPDAGTIDFAYDAAGRLQTIDRADGSITTYTRDGLGRVLTESATWPPGSGQSGSKVHAYTYDSCVEGVGRLCSFTDPSGSTAFAYLASGEIASQTSVIDGATFALAFTYDLYGRLSTVSYPNGVMLRYGYTSAHQIKQIEAQIGGAWQFVIKNAAWQPFNGPAIGYTYGNGKLRDYAHDLDGRVTQIATGVSTLDYSYNANDLVTGITNTNSAASQTFIYSTMRELTSATSTATGAQSWLYDDNGNRTSHVWGGSSDQYVLAPGKNQVASLVGARPRTATYDANGNLQTEVRAGVTVTRKYDGFARLVELSRATGQSLAQPDGTTVNLPAGTWNYEHNALGQRASKYQVGANLRHRALFSPGGLLLGQTNANSTNLDTIYVWLGREPVGIIRNNQVYAVHADHLGRPEAVTNGAKAIVWRANNYAFDRKVTTDSIGGLDIGFPGQTYDAEAATWYNVHRDYDASAGRYIQADPIGFGGGLNLYSYVGGNPVGLIDPFGLHCLSPEEIGAISGAVEGGIAGAPGGFIGVGVGAALGAGVGWMTADAGQTAGLAASTTSGAVGALGSGRAGIVRGAASAGAGVATSAMIGPLGAAVGPYFGEVVSPTPGQWVKVASQLKRASISAAAGAVAGAALKEVLEATLDSDCGCSQ